VAISPIVEEAGERGPAFEHILDRLGDFIAPLQLGNSSRQKFTTSILKLAWPMF